MADVNTILHERLKLLDEYVSALQFLQGFDFKTCEEDKLIRRTVERT